MGYSDSRTLDGFLIILHYFTNKLYDKYSHLKSNLQEYNGVKPYTIFQEFQKWSLQIIFKARISLQ